MKIILFSLLFSFSLFASEGGSAGNGGDVIVCRDENTGQVTSVELLDLFEARVFERLESTRLQGSEDPQFLVNNIVADIGEISYHHSQKLQKAANKFFSKVTWVQQDLPDVPDSRHAALPRNCELHQLAVQEKVNGEVHYTIDERFWREMDAANQAALILHEIFYTEAIEGKHVNSLKTRLLVGFITSSAFKLGAYDRNDWKIPILKKLASLHPRINDFRFHEGLTVFVARESIEDLDRDGQIKVCAFTLPTGEGVNYCETSSIWITIYISRGSAIGQIDVEGPIDPGQSIPGDVLGLPFPVHSYVPNERMIAAAPVIISNEWQDVRCLPAKEIQFTHKYYDFDLSWVRVKKCELDPNYPNQITIGGRKFPIRKYHWNQWVNNGDFLSLILFDDSSFEFTTPQEIEFFGQKLSVSSTSRGIIRLASNANWNFKSSSCEVSGDIGVHGENKYSLNFVKTCSLKRPEGILAVKSGKFDMRNDFYYSELVLSGPSKVKLGTDVIVLKDKVTISEGSIYKGRLQDPVSLLVWEFNPENQYKAGGKRVRRMIPGDVDFTFMAHEGRSLKAFLVSSGSYIYLGTNTFELPLILLEKKRDNLVLMRDIVFVKVRGEIVMAGGRLVSGTLAEKATVKVLEKNDDGFGYKVIWKELPAGTYIRWYYEEGYEYRIP